MRHDTYDDASCMLWTKAQGLPARTNGPEPSRAFSAAPPIFQVVYRTPGKRSRQHWISHTQFGRSLADNFVGVTGLGGRVEPGGPCIRSKVHTQSLSNRKEKSLFQPTKRPEDRVYTLLRPSPTPAGRNMVHRYVPSAFSLLNILGWLDISPPDKKLYKNPTMPANSKVKNAPFPSENKAITTRLIAFANGPKHNLYTFPKASQSPSPVVSTLPRRLRLG